MFLLVVVVFKFEFVSRYSGVLNPVSTRLNERVETNWCLLGLEWECPLEKRQLPHGSPLSTAFRRNTGSQRIKTSAQSDTYIKTQILPSVEAGPFESPFRDKCLNNRKLSLDRQLVPVIPYRAVSSESSESRVGWGRCELP